MIVACHLKGPRWGATTMAALQCLRSVMTWVGAAASWCELSMRSPHLLVLLVLLLVLMC